MGEIVYPQNGAFVISLDFELMWGGIDHNTIDTYGKNIEGAREIIPKLLSFFRKHEIHATWGAVGLLANDGIQNCITGKPKHIPQYEDSNLSTYEHYNEIKAGEERYYFAPDLLREIANTPYQEIGSHTYSHYYCNEQGQTAEDFREDLMRAREVLHPYNENVCSLILPRNQVNREYDYILSEQGFLNYRGCERMWIYEPTSQKSYNSYLRKILRLVDCYINVSGHNCYGYSEIKRDNGLNDIRSSRFLRPYSRKLSILEPLRLNRIKGQMSYAARHNMIFHLWWHPHNFGTNQRKNLRNLSHIVRHYEYLRERYGMKSLNMAEVGEIVK